MSPFPSAEAEIAADETSAFAAPDGLRGLGMMLAPVLAACLLLYHQVLFFGKALYFRDIYHNYYAFLAFIARSLRAGELPLWNPYLFSGTPQLAGLEPPIFYPPGWIFFLGLPYQLALILNLIGHHLLAAAGVYLLGRAYGWRWFSATLAACLFSFSGVMVSMNNFHPLQNTVAWLPLVFWAAHRLLTRQGLRDLAVLGLVYGLQLLSGHLEIVYFETLLLLAYALLVQGAQLRRLRVWLLALAAGLLALGLSAIAILPAIHYLPHSVRQSGLELSSIQLWSLHPFLTLLLILPEQAGNVYHQASLNMIFGEEKFGYSLFFLSAYLGVLTWALLIAGITQARQLGAQRARFGFFLLVFGVSLLLAYGKFTPLYHWLLALPGASFFRYPTKLLVFATFGIVMAAGCAFEVMLGRPVLLRRLMLTLGGLSGLALCAWLGLHAFEGSLRALTQDILHNWRPEVPSASTELWSRFFIYFFDRQLLSFFGLCLLFLGLSWLLLRRQHSRLALAVCLLAITLDLLASGVNSLWLVEHERMDAEPETAVYLRSLGLDRQPQARMLLAANMKQIPESFEPGLQARTTLRAVLYQHDAMENNYSLVSGLRNLYGFWPARSQDSNDLSSRYDQALEVGQLLYRQSYESLGAVRYLVLLDPLPELRALVEGNPLYRHLKTIPATRVEIWENLAWLPRARFQHQAMVLKTRELMIAAMADPVSAGLDFSQHLLLLDDAALAEARRLVPAQEAASKHWTEPEFVSEQNNSLELRFETNTSGYLVLADQNLPGWKAYDNGHEVPILLANYMHRAVRVGPGRHRIRFEYQAPGFALGAAASAISALLLLWLFRLSRGSASSPAEESRNPSHVAASLG